ncbi:uncharacterized protein CHSO_3046 [Chryseobacterium sp. StRB126]|uniref:hypothetical protein n=1 Tax=Chryseobacterium sp. StRB126 TaxID=878220 RepID=UPI0004E99E55|nr:hypothetical protein [Chryseobacterium sp. StRB126]BAP32083.1 uncharacterized protein CHSO_3046 [Chryseobacterium sp. StRB126]
MKEKIRFLILIFGVFYFSISTVFSQVGIQTSNPKGILHIDGAKDNPANDDLSAVQVANDIIINKTTGFIGAGVLNPKVKLDMRSAGNENALGLSTTTMSAVDAGAGAVRYDVANTPVGPKIEVSDGAVWHKAYIAPQKAVVVARKISSQSITQNTATNINNWNIVRDMSNSFDASSGIFTAPRDGTYTFLLTFNFNGAIINDGSRVESQFYNTTSNTILASVYKTFGQSMTGTADDANSTRSTQAGGSSTVTLTLTAGTKVATRLWHNLISSGSVALRVTTNAADPTNPNDGFNNLTIIEH